MFARPENKARDFGRTETLITNIRSRWLRRFAEGSKWVSASCGKHGTHVPVIMFCWFVPSNATDETAAFRIYTPYATTGLRWSSEAWIDFNPVVNET